MDGDSTENKLKRLALECMQRVMSSAYLRAFLRCWNQLQRATRDNLNQDKARFETCSSTQVFTNTVHNSKSHWEDSINFSGENVQDKPNKISRLNLIEEKYARNKIGERRCNSEHGEKGNLCCRDGRERRRIMKEILTKAQGHHCVTAFKTSIDEVSLQQPRWDGINLQRNGLEKTLKGIRDETVKSTMPTNNQVSQEENQSWNQIMAQMRLTRSCLDHVIQMSFINKKCFEEAELGWRRIVDSIVLSSENKQNQTSPQKQTNKIQAEVNLKRPQQQLRPQSFRPAYEILPTQNMKPQIFFKEPAPQIAFRPQPQIIWQTQPGRSLQQSQPLPNVLIELSPVNEVHVPVLEMNTRKPRFGKELQFNFQMPHIDK